VAYRLAERVRHYPSGGREVIKHRMLIRQILRASAGVIAPQHDLLPARHLD
jgi:hypothetical protein